MMVNYNVSKAEIIDGCISLKENDIIYYDHQVNDFSKFLPNKVKLNRLVEETRVGLNKLYGHPVEEPIIKHVKTPLEEKSLIKMIKSYSLNSHRLLFLQNKNKGDNDYVVIKIHNDDRLDKDDYIFFSKISISCSVLE